MPDRTPVELPISLDRTDDAPLPVQLAAALRETIDREAIRPGEPVPATRALAVKLGVARGVVVAAYEQLTAEGYLTAGHGLGTRVHPELGALRLANERGHPHEQDQAPSLSNRPHAAAATEPMASGSALTVEGPPRPLTPGAPDTTLVDTPAWRAAWRQAVAGAHLQAPALGDPRLRTEIAEHLRRMRGTTRPAADVIVTAGTRDGLGLLLAALGSARPPGAGGTAPGRRLRVGVEDPGYRSLGRVAARHGAETVSLPVHADGIDVRTLPADLDAVIVTPSHQYPIGSSLSLARRRELLAWAAEAGVVVVEDDYDSELRLSGNPMPALAALDDPDHGSVVLLGTFSKTVSRALSTGFVLAPARLRRLIEPVRQDLGGAVPAVVQAALADYLSSGELRRHTARMRRRYAVRRDLVLDRLHGLPGVNVRPMSGGLHAVLEFEPSGGAEREQRACAASVRSGLGAVALSEYWQLRDPHADAVRGGIGMFGLVIGTGGAFSMDAFEGALEQLRMILRT